MSYHSQFGEDEWIDQHIALPAKGFYVDVGCGHPVFISNTAFLRERGWSGLNIDMDERWKLAWAEAGLELVTACVWSEPAAVEIVLAVGWHVHHGGPVDSFTRPGTGVVNSVSLQSILDTHGVGAIDFITLDLEGREFEAWQSLDIERHCPKVVVFEHLTHSSRDERLINHFREKLPNYLLCHTTVCNHIFTHESVQFR